MPFSLPLSQSVVRLLDSEFAATFLDVTKPKLRTAIAKALGYPGRPALLADTRGSAGGRTWRSFDGSAFAKAVGGSDSSAAAEEAAARVAVDLVMPHLPPPARAALGDDRGGQFVDALPYLSRLEAARGVPPSHSFVGRVALGCGLAAKRPLSREAVLATAMHLGIRPFIAGDGFLLAVSEASLADAESSVSAATDTKDVVAFIGSLKAWDDVVACALLFGGMDRTRLGAAMDAPTERLEAWVSGRERPSDLAAARTRLAEAVSRERRAWPVGAGGVAAELIEAPSFEEDTTDAAEVSVRVAKSITWALERKAMPVFTVFDRPRDAPDWWVVRLFLNGRPTTFRYLASELRHAREPLRKVGLACHPRQENDDKAIHESWL